MSETIFVIKRNKEKRPLNIKKIQEKTERMTEGLKGVSQSELEVDSKLQFFNGITTEQIQETLVKTAVDKIDIDRPNWTFVAARGFLEDLYHKVGKTLNTKKGSSYSHIETYLNYGINKKRIVPELKEKFNLELINKHIVSERDYLFTYLGVKTLYDRYLLKNEEGEVFELPQYLFMAVSMFLFQNEETPESLEYITKENNVISNLYKKALEAGFITLEIPTTEELKAKYQGEELKKEVRSIWAITIYDLVSQHIIMFATPTLSNARTFRNQLSSCYVNSVPDNIEGIFDNYKENALLSKFGGGIGSDWNSVRGMMGQIDGHKGAAGGIIPFLKIENDVAVAVDQIGTRRGAIAVYIEPWHSDLKDFLDLKKNSGEERRRTHDLFPALWINDLFMERVEKEEDWTLFNPEDVSDLTELYGEEFKKRYEEYEKDENIKKRVFPAVEIWRQALTQYFETGNPFLLWKDSANKTNPNGHKGIIRSSNLCTEIYQNTNPNKYLIEVTLENGEVLTYEEKDIVKTDSGLEKEAKKITNLDSLNGSKVYFVGKKTIEGETAVCNLASINLSKFKGNEELLEFVARIGVRALDNVIDLNYYPVKKAKDTNLKSRAVGLGVMGEAQLLAESKIHWGTEEHFSLIDSVMESISYGAINGSADLSKEKGAYPNFKGSNWSKGIMPIDLANGNAKELTKRELSKDWKALRNKAKEGLRNGYLMAIAPTSSISILTGTSQAIEPIYRKKWIEVNLSGEIPVTAPNLSADTWEYYTTAYDLDQHILIKAGAIRQKWIDQGQSLNIFMRLDKVSGKYLDSIYKTAWKYGLKSTYYLRSESPEATEAPLDRSMECTGCQ